MGLTLDVFVSSPGDLALERKVVGEVVAKLGQQSHLRRSCALRAHFYEQIVPPVLASSAQAAVNTFLMDPARCHVLVCLLGDRLGTPVNDPALDGRSFRSGTEYELVRASESSQRPPPAVLMYLRTPSPGPVDPLERERLTAFLAELEGPEPRFRGIRPAPFGTPEQLRSLLGDHLNAVVTPLVRRHALRRALWWAASVMALLATGLLTHLATRRAEGARSEARQASEDVRRSTAEAEAVLRAALAPEGPWQEVETLDRLGCPAAAPLLGALAKVDADVHLGPALRSRAIVRALGQLATVPGQGERCGCPELLSVLTLTNPVRRYCKSTHRLVLQELGRLGCARRERATCEYLGKIRAITPLKQVVCDGDTVDDVYDLVQVVRPWMGVARVAACLEEGPAP